MPENDKVKIGFDPNKQISYLQGNDKPNNLGIESTRQLGLNAPTYGQSKYDIPNLTPEQDLETGDYNYNRGERQSNLEKWGVGISKAVTKMGVRTLNGVVSPLYGIGSSIANLDISKLWDNELTAYTSEVEQNIDKEFGLYSTKAAEEAKGFAKMGHINFWANDVLDGMSYSGAAMLSGGLYAKALKAIGSLSVFNKVNSTKQVVDDLKLASDQVQYVNELTGKARLLKDGFKNGAVAALGASTEASVEAYNGANEWEKQMREKLSTLPDGTTRDLTEEEEVKIKELRKSVGNAQYAFNLPVIMASNWLTFGKAMMGNKSTERATLKELGEYITKDAGEDVWKKATVSNVRNIINKTYGVRKALGKAIPEGFEELEQFAVEKGTNDYYTKKYYNPDNASFIESMAAGINAAMTEEGLEQFLVGAVSGGIFGNASSIKSEGLKSYKTPYNDVAINDALDYINSVKSKDAFKSTVEMLNRHANISDELEKNFKEGKEFDIANNRSDMFVNYVNHMINMGKTNELRDELESYKKLSQDEFEEVLGIKLDNKKGTTLKESVNEYIDKRLNKISKIEDLSNKIDELFPNVKQNIKDRMLYNSWSLEDVRERTLALNQEVKDIIANEITIANEGNLINTKDFQSADVKLNTLRTDYVFLADQKARKEYKDLIKELNITPFAKDRILNKVEDLDNLKNRREQFIMDYKTLSNPVLQEIISRLDEEADAKVSDKVSENNIKKETEKNTEKKNTHVSNEELLNILNKSVPSDVANDSQVTANQQELEAKKADIERRRQEELDSSTKRYNITKESNLTNNNKIRKFYVWESTDGSSTVAPDNIALNDTKALTEWHESKGHIKVWKEEKVQSDKEFEKSNKENELEYNERNKKINAKYDAELAALDNKKKEVTPVEVELAEVKDTTLDGIVKAYNAETLEEFEPLYESLQKQKHLISEHDLKGLEVKRANLILSKPTPPDVIPDEEVEITISKDQDIVSQTLSKITSSSETEVNQLNDSKDVNNFENQRGIRNSNSTIMMKLFEHTFDKNGMFKWKRNEEGLPLLDNNSLLNIHAINQVQVGDSVTFKLVDLNAQQTSNYILQKVNSLEKGKLSSGDRYVNEEDFDDKHIAIYYKDTKIGFVQQPHSINPTTRSIENSLELRKELIKYRKAVISKLEAGEEVTEKISEKGNGNLYTKLKEDGSIDLINDIFQTPRSKDLIDNTLVFVYSNGEELVLPESEFSIEDTKTIKEVIGKFKKYGKSGKIYQLVQDLNKSWTPIPVYSNRMDAASIKSIMDIINSLDNTSDPKRTVALLNDYIYSSMGKVTADIIVRNLGDILEFSINGTIYNLDEIKNKGPRTDDFINELKTKRQNININKINNFYYQEGLKKRNALSTNVTTFEGEYFVQPYIEYTKTLIKEPKQPKQSKVKPVENTQEEPYTGPTQDLDSLLGGEESLPVEDKIATVENKKADIERRRQEELDKETPLKNENITVDFGGGVSVKYQVITYKDGSVKISTVDEKAKRYNELSDEVFKDYAKIDFKSGAKGIIKTELIKDDYTDKQSQEIKAAKEKTINAKYDAELAALERRRQEELDKVKPDVILPIGTSGSGKSTFIKSLPQENLVVIEPDAMRVEFTGDINDKSKDKEIYEEAAKRAVAVLKANNPIDVEKLSPEERLRYYKILDMKKSDGSEITLKDINENPALYQLTQNREIEEFVASEKTIRDLAARMSDRIGIPVRFVSDRSKEYKGKLENGTAVVNLAYATLDTPIHEILAHPIIRAIKNRNRGFATKGDLVVDKKGNEFKVKYVNEDYDFVLENGNTVSSHDYSLSPKSKTSQLYQSLVKELETGRGKEVLDRVKKDYVNKSNEYDYFKGEKISDEEYNNINVNEVKTGSDEYLSRDFYEKRIDNKVYTIQKGEDANPNSAKVYTLPTYSLEEQQEEALVELLGLMTAGKLDSVKDGKLISLLKRLLKEIKAFVRDLLKQREVEIDKLPDTMTLGDLSDLLAYSNSKLILPGYEVEYTTPDNMKFKTYSEASKHISDLAKNVEDVDLDNVKFNTNKILHEQEYESGMFRYKTNEGWYFKNLGEDSEGLPTNELTAKYSFRDNNKNNISISKEEYENNLKNSIGIPRDNKLYQNPVTIQDFIEKNKEYEQSKEIIEEWKKVNNIQYNPEEIYSRGQEFSSVVGAYSSFDVNLMMQNLLSHIEDNEKAGGKFAISAYTKPIDKQIGHLEGGGGKIKFKIYPQSNDILWAANTDVYSGSVWDASEKVNKDKKSELLGVSYTKYPSLSNVNTVQPNLANIVDNLNHHHNELGIVLTGNNFRLEYDEDIPYTTKKIIDGINKILDQKYGKLVKPEIKEKNIKEEVTYDLVILDDDGYPKATAKRGFTTLEEAKQFGEQNKDKYIKWSGSYKYKKVITKTKGIQPTKTNETLKESIDSVRSKFNTEIKDSEISSEESFTQNGWTYTFADWMDENEKFSKYKFIDGQIKTEYISKESFNQAKEEYLSKGKKEYTSQALINTKIAALKEVAKKQPRSLIRSEVKPIKASAFAGSKMYNAGFDPDELPFQKLSKSPKEILQEKLNEQVKNNKQVVFDTTNLTKDKRLPFIEAIKKAIPTANIQYKLMELNPELAKQRIKAQLERGEKRANVSDATIDRHAESYKQMLKDIKTEPITEFKSNEETLDEVEKQSTQLNENVDVTSKLSTDNTTSTLDDKYKDIDEDSIMNGDDAFSKTLLTNKELNRSEFKKWLSKNLPQFTLSDVELLKDIKDNSVDAYGMFRDSTIYLFEGATMGIAYHEAFHGVFRNLLSNEDKFKLIEEAISKYTAPTTEDLYNLQQGLTRDYNNEELTFLYYEEKLAEAFDKFSTDYNNKSIGDKILAFFNKILAFFKLVKSNPNDNIEELFNNIHKGNYSNIQSSPKGTKIINRELQIDNAYSRKLDEAGFKPSEKLKFTQSIGNQFLKIYQDNLLANKDIRPLLIWEEIKDRYTEYALNANLETDLIAGVKAKRIVQNFNEFRKEATKYLSFRGVRINEEYLEFGNDLIEDNLGDEEVEALRSTTTKGFGDWTSVSGLSSASTRIKLFLSSIPIIDDNGNPKVDMFGIQEYYDFNKLYYYIERNLTDLYTFEDQLEELKRLSVGHPEIQQVVNMLENKSSDITNEQFVQIQNDFKTNFSKQQMSFTLVKFDTNSSTGEVNFRILDANRQSLKREIFETWSKNLEDDTRKTITEFTKEGDINKFGTSTVKELSSKWDKLQSTKGILNYSVVNDILTKLGIDFTPSVLEGLIKDNTNEFRSNISKVLKYYSDNIDSDTFNVNEKTGRIALSELVNYEVNASFDSYTSSFNNVENKAIYTIQLPSFASRLISRLRSTNVNVFRNTITELEKDSFYKHSNLLEELKTDVTFRKNGFKLSYIDGLKDEKGESKGSKFTNMTPKDFLSMEVALFQNTAANSNKKAKESLHKYVYITPSDKTMGMIFDAKAYEVTLTNDNINLNSEILGKFYNIFLQESNRIKHNLLIKDDILANKDNSKYLLSDLLQYYHISKSNWDDFSELADKQANGETLTDKEWNSISKMFTGQAFQYNYFSQSFNSIIKRTIADTMLSSTLEDLEKNLESFRDTILVEMRKELQHEYKNTREEFKNKGIISKNDKTGLYENIALSLTSKDSQNVNNEINQLIANFSLNTMLHNIEFSNLLNGDVSLYKPNDLQKRTYQSQSMITNNNFENKIIKTMVIKDYETGSQQYENIVSTLKQLGFTDDQIKPIAGKYKKGINVTDAQVYITPEFYKRIHISRGTWSPEMQEAYDIAEGKKTGIISEAYHRLLAGIKPFYFGNRFDSHLGIQRYEQVKCAMLPLFKSYIDLNPLLASKRQEMSNLGVDMLAHESSFKATIGNRNDITGDPGIVLELNTDNFGIQVDNPDHMADGNDSMRQLKMLILGSIDPTKTYKGTNGKEIIDSILRMEATNIKESFNLLQQKMDFKNNIDFANFIKDAITKRGATINIEEALNIIDGDFEYALDNGNLSTQIENMISSIYTNNVIKQEFAVGGSTVQASSIGFKYKNLEEQQEGLTEDAKLLQQQLSWIKPNLEDGSIGYAECAMPAWSKDFFESNGKLKDIDSIPEELKQLLTYRIPTEGLHSMLPIKVVKFLPETMGNFMLLPYEVTTQLGADFDFDKTYFIGKEFYKDTTDGENINLVPYKYINGTDNESLSERWKQYHKYTSINRLPQKYETIEDFKELSIEDQNVKGARNNKILENYLHLLTSIENLELLITPSGFDTLSYFKDKYFKEQSKTHGDDSFFSSRIQRDYKERNHIGIALKGQSALHVSGHSYATLMNLVSKTPIKFNDIVSDNFSGLYTKNGKLIADELSSIMAAILDDIKNPLLKYLGINNNTIDVLATIIRAGYDMETGLNFVSQPGVKELSSLLTKNKDKIKESKQGYYNIDTVISSYNNSLQKYIEGLPNAKAIVESSNDDNISDEDLVYYISKWNDIKESDKSNEDWAKYYAFQVKVLKSFQSIVTISDELVNINKFFAINKEVGPNIENIIAKTDIYEQILASTIITGFDINKIPSLKETYEVHKNALKWFERYFPYSTDTYLDIKKQLLSLQTSKKLNQIPIEDKMFMNGFIRAYMDYSSNMLNETPYKYNKLFKELPLLLKDIKDATKKDNKLGNLTYKQIRQNTFIENIKVSLDKNNNIWNITLKGNRIDLQVKNNIIQGFEALYNNTSTKQLAIDLIEHSFVSSGFFSGLNNYSNLINPNILKDLGYNTFRKNIVNNLRNNLVSLQEEDINRIVDQIIRNNPKPFTKVFDDTMFGINGKALPDTITTTEAAVKEAKRGSDFFFGDTEDPSTPTYIRVYDKERKRSSIFKKDINNNFKYKKIDNLGKKGYFMEINPSEDITKSYLKENSGISKNTMESDFEDEISQEALNIPEGIDNVVLSTKVNKYEITDEEDFLNTKDIDELPPIEPCD